ncbi:MAG: PAS domain S-box protein [Chloroflexi bacterium]|nr:PAS domain S-box protein [Chloroflexota bacterium]
MRDWIRVLCVDSSADDRDLIRRTLERKRGEFRVTLATSVQDFEIRLAQGSYDIFLIEFGDQGAGGLHALSLASTRAPDAPVIMLIPLESEDLASEAVQWGVSDYVLKTPKFARRLPDVLRTALEQADEADELTHTKLALLAAEERYTTVVHSIPEAVILSRFDDDQIVEVNSHWERRFGYSRIDAVGKTADDLKLYTDLADRQQLVALLRREGGVQGHELRLRHKSGRVLHASLNAEVIELDGDPYVLFVIQNISERRRLEAALHDSEARCRVLDDSFTDALFMLDRELRCVWVNGAAEALTGTRDADAIARPLWDILPDSPSKQRLVDALRAVLDDGTPRGITETWFFRGASCTLDVCIRPRDEGLLVVMHDITDRVDNESHLQWEVSVRTTLSSVCDAIARSNGDSHEVTALIFDYAKVLTRSRRGCVAWLDSHAASLVCEVELGLVGDGDLADDGQTILLRADPDGHYRGLVGHAIETGEAFFANAPSSHPAFALTYDAGFQFRSVLCTPIVLGDAPIGEILLADTEEHYSDRELAAVRRLAQLCALGYACLGDGAQSGDRGERYRRLLDHSIIGVFSSTAEGRVIDANPAFARTLGYSSPREVIEKGVSIAHDVCADPVCWTESLGVLRNDDAVHVETAFRRADGSEFSGVIHAWMVQGAHGEGLTVEGLIEDIGQRRTAEEALRASEEKYRSYIDSAPDAIFVFEPSGLLLEANAAGTRVTGYDIDELVGREILALVHEKSSGKARRLLSDVFAKGRAGGEIQIIRRDGAVRWIDTEQVRLSDSAALAFYRDITDRKWAEEQARYRARNLAAVSELAIELAAASPDVDLAQLIADKLRQLTRTMMTILSSFDRERGRFTIERISGMDDALTAVRDLTGTHLVGVTVDVRPQQVRQILREVVTVSLDPAGASQVSVPEPVARLLQGEFHIERFVGLALIYGGELVGLATIVVRADDVLSSLDVLRAFAHVAAISWRRKQAEDALMQYNERLMALRDLDTAVLAAWSAEETTRAALRHLRRLVPAVGAWIVMFDHSAQQTVLAVWDFDMRFDLEQGMRLPYGGVFDVGILSSGQTIILNDFTPQTDESPLGRTLQAMGVHSCIAAPLIVHDEMIGSIAVAALEPHAYASDHADVVNEVAAQLAVALHQADLRQALEVEQRRLAALVASLPEGVLLLDDERRIQLCNPVAEAYLARLTEAGLGDVLQSLGGVSLDDLLHRKVEDPWQELVIAGPPQTIFEIACELVVGETGRPGWVLLIRDTTEEHEARERIQRQDQLAAVGQLAGGIAHDFNNLLTTMMLYAEMSLNDSTASPSMVRAFDTILAESKRGAHLVQQILDFSRRSPIERAPVDLRPFLTEAIDVLERTIPENIRFRLDVDAYGDEKFVASVDPTRIQQLLLNLVVNARDAMPHGGELRIRLSKLHVRPGMEPAVADMSPGSWICLSVIDRGIGIPSDVLPHIFEPFFTTKPPGKGAGLGLAQVYGIVSQHDGLIDVDTALGQGTAFHIYFPEFREIQATTETQQRQAPPRGNGEVVLVAEDQDRLRELARDILDSLGYRVLTASNGQQALEVYRSADHVDLLVTDVVMPEMGGGELLRVLRESVPDLKAIAMTGYGIEQEIGHLRDAHVSEVLRKPFDVQVLAVAVRRALDQT